MNSISTYESIKRDILSNRLRPGTKLTNQMLAENLGVSRTPVRESLERLCQEGYVKRVINRGYFVVEMDTDEVKALYQMREALELFALPIVIEQISVEQLSILHELNNRYRQLCSEPLSRERLLVDRDFHLQITAYSGNQYMYQVLAGIFDRLILKRRVEGFHDGRGLVPSQDHDLLLSAMEARNTQLALQILQTHINGACFRFLDYLRTDLTSANTH